MCRPSLALVLALAAAPACAAPTAQDAFDRGAALDVGGNGASPDAEAALGWYRRAAAAELPAAQLNAALMYDSGRGTSRDATRAASLYGAAAAHGDARAAYDLGQLYATGDGVPRNAAAAHAWFDIAAARGIQAALNKPVPDLPGDRALPPTLTPAAPLQPTDVALTPQGRDVALVWSAPPQPRAMGRTATYVQVVSRNGPAQHLVFSGFAPATATIVTLPPGRGTYAWRTLTVAPAHAHYAASEWALFTAEVEGSK